MNINKLRNGLRLKVRQLGQGMTEYIIIVALIAIAAIAAAAFFGGTVRSQIGGMAEELAGKSGTASIQSASTAADNAVTQHASKGLGNYQNPADAHQTNTVGGG